MGLTIDVAVSLCLSSTSQCRTAVRTLL